MIFPFEKKSIHQQDSGETMGNLYPVRGSDRDCVVFVKQVHFSYSEHQEHLIPLYYKADWDQLRRAMTDLAHRMEPPKDSATNEEMWTLFRDTLRTAISDCISHTIRLGSRRVSPGSRPLLASSLRGVSRFSRRCRSKAQRNWRSCANNSKQKSSASCRERTGPTWTQPLKMPTLSKPPRTNAGLNHPRQMLKSCLIPTRCTARTGTVMEVGYEVPELQEDCEMIWVKLKLQGRETLYICTTDRMLLVKLPCHGLTPLLLKLQLSPTLTSSLAVTSTSPAGTGNWWPWNLNLPAHDFITSSSPCWTTKVWNCSLRNLHALTTPWTW